MNFFYNLKKISNRDVQNTETFCEWLSLVSQDLKMRFIDFEKVRVLIDFGTDPRKISSDEISEIGQLLGIDLFKLKSEFIEFKSKSLCSRYDDFLKIIVNYDVLKIAYAKVLSIFPSSYSCEAAFSRMNFILNEFRSSLTQTHLKNCLVIACSEIELDFEKFVKTIKNCQFSH